MLTNAIIAGLLWFAAISCGLLAGVYFAFSAFIMTAFGQIDGPSGSAAMTAINRVILRSPFMPLFFGSTLAALILAIVGALCLPSAYGIALLAGGSIYAIGMFGVTVARNVPLNNRLERASGDLDLWQDYLRRWTRWNHVRTLASTSAMAAFIHALTL